MKLQDIEYEISQMFLALEECEPEERESLQIKIDEYLKELKFQEADKADAIAYMFRSQNSRVEFLKAEEKRIKAKRQAIENQVQRSKDYFRDLMVAYDLKKISGNSSTLSLRNSQQVSISGEAQHAPELFLPKDCWRHETTVKIDKNEIKSRLKLGEVVEGCELINNVSFNVR